MNEQAINIFLGSNGNSSQQNCNTVILMPVDRSYAPVLRKKTRQGQKHLAGCFVSCWVVR